MREQLIQYVNLLFAGAADSEEIKQEILQNTLDRYDDLLGQGKKPEAAYRLAISGIGDINEILGNHAPVPQPQTFKEAIHEEVEDIQSKKLRAVAIAMYILCAVPLIILSEFGMDTLGLCLTLALVATATYLIIISKKKDDDEESEVEVATHEPKKELHESVDSLIWAIGLAVYFIVSFTTGAWYITWVIFPLIGCVQGLVKACMDLREAK